MVYKVTKSSYKYTLNMRSKTVLNTIIMFTTILPGLQNYNNGIPF